MQLFDIKERRRKVTWKQCTFYWLVTKPHWKSHQKSPQKPYSIEYLIAVYFTFKSKLAFDFDLQVIYRFVRLFWLCDLAWKSSILLNKICSTRNPRRRLRRLLLARPAGGWLASLATTPGAHPPPTHLEFNHQNLLNSTFSIFGLGWPRRCP